MSLSSDNTVMTMPVTPAYQGGGYGNSMWGGDWASWIILFLIFGMFGWGNGFGGGFGGNGGTNGPGFQGWATRADINEGFALNGLQNGQNSIRDAVSNGFHGVDNAVCTLGYQTQQGFNALGAQMAQCCCDTQRAIDGVNYNMATQGRFRRPWSLYTVPVPFALFKAFLFSATCFFPHKGQKIEYSGISFLHLIHNIDNTPSIC